MNWSSLPGKTVLGFRGHKVARFGKEEVTVSCILFDDRKTFLLLHEQDPYDHHDCCSFARIITLCDDAKLWQRMYYEEDGWLNSSTETTDPFW